MAGLEDLSCLRSEPSGGDGCELRVQVQPNARCSAVAGMQGEALRVRLAAPPIEGRANAELLRWLARELDLPRRAVTLRAGELSRHKRVHLACAPERVAAWLRAQLGAE